MRNKPDKSANTSRRNFAKSIGAAMALPLASSFAGATDAFASGKREQKKQAPARVRKTHDTPPPITVDEGSLTVQSVRSLRAKPGGGRFRFIDDAADSIGHIRVIQGNGDMVYQDLDAEGSEIILTLMRDNGASAGDWKINVQTIDGSTNVMVDSDRNLSPSTLNHGRRKHRLGHPGNSDANAFRINQIVVRKGGQQVFKTVAPNTSGDEFSAEYRIMVWPH